MPFKLYKRGKFWHYRGSHDGRELRGSCRTTDKRRAQEIVAQIEEKLHYSRLNQFDETLTFAQASMHYRAAGRYDRFLEIAEDFWRDMKVSDIRPAKIRQAALTVYPNHSGATRNRQFIVPTQAVINHAADLELCPYIKVKRFKVTTKVKETVDWEWVQTFMDHSSPHMGALCAFMFLTAARISEAIDLRWGDVDLNKATALIRQTKIGVERVANLPPELVIAIANIEGEREPAGKVFRYSSRSTAKHVWKAVIERAGLPYRTFHCCRHGFATEMLKSHSPAVVAKLGGWQDQATLLRTYSHATGDVTANNSLTFAQNSHNELSKTRKNA